MKGFRLLWECVRERRGKGDEREDLGFVDGEVERVEWWDGVMVGEVGFFELMKWNDWVLGVD